MVQETLVALAIGSALLGGLLSTLQGYFRSEPATGYSTKKLLSAFISSGFVAFGLVNLAGIQDVVNTVGLVGLFIANVLLGYGVDKGISALDK